ncbi:YccF family protein [Sinorhizobium medicae]|nr:YccF family protein [Sinorhizobium medicae]
MRFAGNVIWFVFGGWYIALLWLVGAGAAALTIVGLPLSRAAIEMAKLSAFPFGKDVVHVRELDGKGTTAITALTGTIGFIVNVAWACTFGIVLFLGYLFAGVINCIFLITIPFGLQSFKLAGLSFWPVGRRVVPIELANEVRKRNAEKKLDKIRGTQVATQQG